MRSSDSVPVPVIGPDPGDYCHDCETADALDVKGWCDDPRCRVNRFGGGREERGAGRAEPEGGGSP